MTKSNETGTKRTETTFVRGVRMEQSIIKTTDNGAEMSINTDRIVITEEDYPHGMYETTPGDSVKLSMADIHTITRILSERYGVDISSPDFQKQIEV